MAMVLHEEIFSSCGTIIESGPSFSFGRLCRSQLILWLSAENILASMHVALEMRYEYFAVTRDQVVSLGLKTKT